MNLEDIKLEYPEIQAFIDGGNDVTILKKDGEYFPVFVMGDEAIIERFLEHLEDGDIEVLPGKKVHYVNNAFEFECRNRDCSKYAIPQPRIIGYQTGVSLCLPRQYCFSCHEEMWHLPKMTVG
ncbi:hypothetical protein LCGC14_1323700 [marine sediment metagenome]|uniref:Uncharacterized protein n=1 Tax=marine sediment metagenome TaxID=412755 RepID=A0A0F9L4A9_9ZZZZ|nr:hypothetical protein [Pricia sp.]